MPARADPVLTVGHDKASGIIRVVGTGLWTVAYIEEHFIAVGALMDRVRKHGAGVMVLVDLSGAPVQTADVARHISIGTDRIFRSPDRLALLVQSPLAKLQLKRVVTRANTAIFVSRHAAEAWLVG